MRPITPERVLSMRMRLAACFEPPRMLESPDGPLLNFSAACVALLETCAESIAQGRTAPAEWSDALDTFERLLDGDYAGLTGWMVESARSARLVAGGRN
jgi:hypothetical protein